MGGVRLRLTRLGRKKRPFYRIVVADSRARRDGNQIETLGYYDPLAGKDDEKRLKINPERAKIKGSILAFQDISGNLFSTSKGTNGSFSGVLGRS